MSKKPKPLEVAVTKDLLVLLRVPVSGDLLLSVEQARHLGRILQQNADTAEQVQAEQRRRMQ